jgi:hypothetical protein
LLAQGLAALQLEAGGFPSRPKGAPEKQVLAWWLCQHTTARRRWVSERLEMGDESRVTQAIRQVKGNLHHGLARMKKRLEQEYGSDR